MSAGRWTPGPWRWWTSNSFRRLSSDATGGDGGVLCAVVQHSDGHPDVYLKNGGWDGPDGRLIAAAPEMADALETLIDCWLLGLPAGQFAKRVSYHMVEARALLTRIKGAPTC